MWYSVFFWLSYIVMTEQFTHFDSNVPVSLDGIWPCQFLRGCLWRLWGSDSPTPLSSITTWWKGLSARLFHWLSALTFYFSPDISRFLDFSDLEWCSYSIPVNTKPMLSTLNLAINQTLALCKLCSPALALRRPNHLMRCSKPGTRKATKESCQYLCGFNKSKSLVPFHSISDSKNACILGS